MERKKVMAEHQHHVEDELARKKTGAMNDYLDALADQQPDVSHSVTESTNKIKADRPLTRDTLNAPCLLKNRQFQRTGNGHSQLPLAELGKLSPKIDMLRTTGSNGRA